MEKLYPNQIFNQKETKQKRRLLRTRQTDAENKLWFQLRNKRFLNLKFFRQYAIGPYIADFYCPRLGLAIEVDGGQHFSDPGIAYDRQREEYFISLGIETLRFSNLEVLKQMNGVLKSIQERIKELHASPYFPIRDVYR